MRPKTVPGTFPPSGTFSALWHLFRLQPPENKGVKQERDFRLFRMDKMGKKLRPYPVKSREPTQTPARQGFPSWCHTGKPPDSLLGFFIPFQSVHISCLS